MAPTGCPVQAPVPPPSYHRTMATALHLDALTLVTRLELLTLCRLAVQLAQRQCPPPLPAGPGGAPRIYSEASLLVLALLRTLWRLSYQELHDWLCAWPALALACGLPLGPDGRVRVPSKAQQSKRLRAVGAPASEMLFVLLVRAGLWMGLTQARDLIIDSAPILAWRRAGQAHQHRAVLRPRPRLLPPAAPASMRLVRGRDAHRADVRRGLGDCPGRLAARAPHLHPLATARPRPRLGRGGGLKRPRS